MSTQVKRIAKSHVLCASAPIYRGFSLNPAHFALNIAGPRPAAKVRNEPRWRFCSARLLQLSTLSHVVAQRPKASYHAGLSYLDASFIVNLTADSAEIDELERFWALTREKTARKLAGFGAFLAQTRVITRAFPPGKLLCFGGGLNSLQWMKSCNN